MTKSFAELKKKRNNAQKNVEKLKESLTSSKKNFHDDRFWTISKDKAGNGVAVIRFLPEPPGEKVPFVETFSHGFQGPTGQWYFENCLTTLGKDDPVCERNTELWSTGLKENKDIASSRARKHIFISNILVVQDPANPENEGKVFLFSYGKTIANKIKKAAGENSDMKIQGEENFDPFDFWTGANFKMVLGQKKSQKQNLTYNDYSESYFLAPAPIKENDEEIEKIWKSEYSLEEFIDPKNFKPYDELKERLLKVLGEKNTNTGQVQQNNVNINNNTNNNETVNLTPAESNNNNDEDDDIDLEKLKSMADDDDEDLPF